MTRTEPTFAEQELQRRLMDMQRDLFHALAELAECRQQAEQDKPAVGFVFALGGFVGALTMLALWLQ